MGTFTAVSAFRDVSPAALTAAIEAFVARQGAATVRPGSAPGAARIHVFAPAGGWTVVRWPDYFGDVLAATELSRALGTLAASVHVHDGDLWVHTLVRDGERLDRFASVPDYFAEDVGELAALAARWQGSPAVVAEALGCPVDVVAAYFVALAEEDEEPVPEGPALAGDRFDLADPRVFCDLWRRAGIICPDDAEPAAELALADGWAELLVADEDDAL